ncbi:MAG TPA: glycosyltransferase family 39 protein [Terriglobales bacterium]
MLSSADNARVSSAGEPSGDAGRSARTALWLWAIVIAGLVLRLIALGYKSFWIDEIASVAIARRASQTFWHFLWHDEGNMAGYYVLLRPWLYFGYGEGTVRVLSVIPGVISIPVMYVLGRKLFGQRTAIIATLLLSLNACSIFISQEARAYSFVLLAVLLSTFLFVRLIESPAYGVACAYAIVAGLSCYFHYFCVLVPVAHYAAVIGLRANRRPWKALMLSATIIVVMTAPILWLMHVQDTGHISWVQPTSWLELYHLGAYLAAASGKALGAVLLALNLVLVGFFLRGFRTAWSGVDGRWRWLLVASLVATPIVITLLASLIRPAFYHRFLVICLPGWVLMTALGVEQIRIQGWRVAAITGVCGLSLASTVILYHRVTEDWRDAVDHLISNGQPADRVLYYQSVGEFAGENYRDWLPGGSAPRPKPIAVDPAARDWERQIADAPRVWLVVYRAKPNDAEVDQIQEKLNERALSLKMVSSYPGVTLMEFVRK